MTDSEKTAFEEESEKLADVVQFIEEERVQLLGQMPAKAAHQEAADEIQRILRANADNLYAALDQPYFGRLDYLDNGVAGRGDFVKGDVEVGGPSQPRTRYFGIKAIIEKDISSWTVPVAKLWYSPSDGNGYTAPKGFIATTVNLKRYSRIRNRRLEAVNDTFRRQLPAASTGQEAVLRQALSGVGAEDGHLQVIVETIEPDQYEAIANVTDRVLIVQGAAGSGKSEIGLHRVAFLLSPFNEIPENERPTPDTTLFVGPSQTFMEYAADILPSLDVQERVDQVRFRPWMIGNMSVRPRIRNRMWNRLLSEGEIFPYNEHVESFKGSLGMADVLEKQVAEKAFAIRHRCGQLLDTIPGSDEGGAVIEFQALSTLLGDILPRGYRGLFLNRRRQDFIRRVVRRIVANQGPVRRDRAEAERNTREVTETVVRWCDEVWEQIDFRTEYISLIADQARMMRLAGSILPVDIANELASSSAENRGGFFQDSDLGALAYLDHLLNGSFEGNRRHIVVDEAQDLSPIEFKLLTASSANNWFTVLGDLSQRLTPYRGIKSWRELERVFGRSNIQVQRARRSYRSTTHITNFNNRILKTFDTNISSPIAFSRQGPRVEYCRYGAVDAMYRGIIDDLARIRSFEGLTDAVVAILVRDRRNLNNFKRYCEDAGMNEVSMVDQDTYSSARTVLARISDVKGLEYDAVMVMGVNDSFRDSLFNKKLLYLATTRAKHYLAIHWSGQQSPILRSVSSRGIKWHRRGTKR